MALAGFFEDDAVDAIAQKAIEQNTGARGIRSIVEGMMMDIMYRIPSIPNVKQVIVSRESVLNRKNPKIIGTDGKEIAL